MKKQFIPYIQALELKELGFDEQCFLNWYVPDNSAPILEDINDDILSNYYVKAPLWQQAFDWFREKHNLYFEIFNSPMYVHNAWKFRTYNIENSRLRNANVSKNFSTYEETRLACLIELIAIIKTTLHENRLQ